MIDEGEKIPVVEQCEILTMNRSTFYYKPVPDFTEEELFILGRMDNIFTDFPFYGYRRMWWTLCEEGHVIGRDRTRHYMNVLGLETFYPKKRKTSIPNKEHKKYPYLLRDLEVNRPNQVWAADITYIRMAKGFCYLVVVMDWYSRYILSWRLSTTLEAGFCVDALQDALSRYGAPEIFNTDQGSQFTSADFTGVLLAHHIRISMDSKGRALDNVFVERFFRTLKYEYIYLNEIPSIAELKEGLKVFFHRYHHVNPHSSHNMQRPYDVYTAPTKVISIDVKRRKEVFDLWLSTISELSTKKGKRSKKERNRHCGYGVISL